LNLGDKIVFILAFCSSFLLLVSMWQIEIIWICLQNGWIYGLPFGFETYNYWLAHDFWFTLIFTSWVLLATSLMLEYRRTSPHARSEKTTTEFNILTLLYAIVTSGIAWFLLWFAYDIMEIWHFLKSGTFTNLALTICLIVFVIFVGIEQLKEVLKEMKNNNSRAQKKGGNM